MTIEAAIAHRLGSLAPVVALVAARVYQMKLPQGASLPAVKVQLISEVVEQGQRGPDRLVTTRIQVDAYAEESGSGYTTATNLAAAIHGNGLGANATGLQGFVGDAGGSPPTVHIAGAFRILRLPRYVPPELRQYVVQQDYEVKWWSL